MIILIYSQNCFLSQVFRLCGALCTTYFIWSSGKRGRSSVGYGLHGPYYKVPRQLTKNTGGLLRPTFGTQFYLQWPKHLSYGQNKNQWKLFWRYGNVFHRQWEKQCSEYLLSSNANMHTPHLFSCSQILIHFSVLSAITVGLLPSYLLRFYPHSALSRIPLSSCHHWSSFITLSARNFRLNPYS